MTITNTSTKVNTRKARDVAATEATEQSNPMSAAFAEALAQAVPMTAETRISFQTLEEEQAEANSGTQQTEPVKATASASSESPKEELSKKATKALKDLKAAMKELRKASKVGKEEPTTAIAKAAAPALNFLIGSDIDEAKAAVKKAMTKFTKVVLSEECEKSGVELSPKLEALIETIAKLTYASTFGTVKEVAKLNAKIPANDAKLAEMFSSRVGSQMPT